MSSNKKIEQIARKLSINEDADQKSTNSQRIEQAAIYLLEAMDAVERITNHMRPKGSYVGLTQEQSDKLWKVCVDIEDNIKILNNLVTETA